MAKKISWTLTKEQGQRRRQYLRHFVALTWTDYSLNPKDKHPPRTNFLSGFMISFEGEWLWVTAGHIAEEYLKFRRQAKDQNRMIKDMAFMDNWQKQFTDQGVPHDPPDEFFRLYKESEGYDFAFLPINKIQQANFERNGIVALAEDRWDNGPKQFNGFEMMGLPKSMIDSSQTETSIHSSAKIMTAPLEYIVPPKHLIKKCPMFYGKLIDRKSDGSPNGLVLADVDGMSGGPIFGLEVLKNGRVIYWPLAIQSGWFSDLRICYGTFLRHMMLSIRRGLKKMDAKNKKNRLKKKGKK